MMVMAEDPKSRQLTQIERQEPLFREALRLHEIEGCPLDDEQIAMFDMFHREGWSEEKCLAYIKDSFARRNPAPPIE